MKQSRSPARRWVLVVTGMLVSCGGRAALEQLAKLEEQACTCRGGADCRPQVEALAAQWVAEHGSARIANSSRAEALVSAIADCDLAVAQALAEVP